MVPNYKFLIVLRNFHPMVLVRYIYIYTINYHKPSLEFSHFGNSERVHPTWGCEFYGPPSGWLHLFAHRGPSKPSKAGAGEKGARPVLDDGLFFRENRANWKIPTINCYGGWVRWENRVCSCGPWLSVRYVTNNQRVHSSMGPQFVS